MGITHQKNSSLSRLREASPDPQLSLKAAAREACPDLISRRKCPHPAPHACPEGGGPGRVATGQRESHQGKEGLLARRLKGARPCLPCCSQLPLASPLSPMAFRLGGGPQLLQPAPACLCRLSSALMLCPLPTPLGLCTGWHGKAPPGSGCEPLGKSLSPGPRSPR